MNDHLITPYGGTFVDLMANEESVMEAKSHSKEWHSWNLKPRQLCDLELIMNGGFSPLAGFMTERDYDGVCKEMKLADGTIWPMPITLDVDDETAGLVDSGDALVLRDAEGLMLAVLHVEEKWQPEKATEAEAVFGTQSEEHPAVRHLMHDTGNWYIGGKIEGIQMPEHYDFGTLRQSPAEMRAEFSRLGWRKIIAFQTRNPMHRAHFELTMRAIRENEADLLIHPVVGMTKPGDIDHFTRVRCYQALMPHYPANTVKLSLLPLAMRMGGPREALWHAIIRRNYGCTHLIVGRDHAGPGSDSKGKPFYGPYDAQEMLQKHAKDIGVEMVPFRLMVYLENEDRYLPIDDVTDDQKTLNISGTELRERLADGREIPSWFTFAEVASELKRTHPPRYKQGFTVFFTGLSGSGKSTIANALLVKLLESGGRPVTLLDGDIVRKNLSSELGFSKEHRDLNIQRIGFVANEITKNGGVAICAPIAPYDAVRRQVQTLIEGHGGFVLIHVSTPLLVCEQRDRKGLYAKARAGIIKEFTGISDPYEVPTNAAMAIDTSNLSPEEAVQDVLLHLEKEGYIAGNNRG